jgi:hypothetical protein
MIRKIAELKPYEKNARKHSQAQLEQIKNSIKEFGFTAPVLIDENNMVLAGHGRLEGAKLAGLKEVPVRVIEGLSEQQKRAYILADNKIALNAEWDEELLASELAQLSSMDFDFGFGILNIETTKPSFEPEDEDEDEDEDDAGEYPTSGLKAPFPYFGGKSKIAGQVWARFGDVKNYVEPFCGSAAMLLARPDYTGQTETINDADGFVSNFYRALQAAPDEVAHYTD